MLFNSATFLFIFLPTTMATFLIFGAISGRLAMVTLLVASLIFYGCWQPSNLILLSVSIIFNYGIGVFVSDDGRRSSDFRRMVLIAGITADIATLAFYKYAVFLIGMVSDLSGVALYVSPILLPLGISFFTFTQIAFLVDSFRGEAKEYNFIDYALFVTYFPHLIAGPILHHREIMPQFAQRTRRMSNAGNISVGLTIFVVGLFKKVIFADSLVQYVDPVFADHNPTLIEAWAGAVGYTLQIYFDFSGYSDMAIGLSRMFGIVLPLNFASPYQASSIIEFWRRWHMTLSRFLRDYLYFALGGNRKGKWRRYLNLMMTMLLGGLWHGANWTFVVWGGLHGLYLVVNHLWRSLRGSRSDTTGLGRRGGWWKCPLTFLCVVVAWVFFRADTLSDAWAMLSGMVGLNGILVPTSWTTEPLRGILAAHIPGMLFWDTPYLTDYRMYGTIGGLLMVAWFAPATHELFALFRPALNAGLRPDDCRRPWLWRPTWGLALATASLAIIAIVNLNQKSAFIYWNF